MNEQQLKKLQTLRKKPKTDWYPGESGIGPYFADALLTGNLADLVDMCDGQSFGLGAYAKAFLDQAMDEISDALGEKSSQKIPLPIGVGTAGRLNINYDQTEKTGNGVKIAVPWVTVRRARRIISEI